MNVSQIITAGTNWVGVFSPDQFPDNKGLYGREVVIDCNGVHIDGSKLDVAFSVPFDDTLGQDEAEITVYNLSKTSISKLAYNQNIKIRAGYKGNTGIIFSGYVCKKTVTRDGADLKIVVRALDSMKLKEREIKQIAYSAGTSAKKILNDLIKMTGLKVAVFKPAGDVSFSKAVNVSGKLFDNINKYAEMCSSSAYINKGQIYVRTLKDGDKTSVELSAEKGLVGSPEAFEEEVKKDKKVYSIKGYKLKCLLNNKISTGSIVKVKSLDCNGSFRVRSGKHISNGTDFYTELEVIS